jgi:urate oxidase / 2-oxo-4-hydroxy-4-carboxy-5-ureidoimidazoline decarboxylase
MKIEMEHFSTGWKKNYYGKGDVIAYRLHRGEKPPSGQSPVFGVNVKILIYGEAFWATYTTGDNSGLIATDSMKNFVQRETLNYPGGDLEEYCRFLGEKFLTIYPQVEGVQMSAVEIPFTETSRAGVAFTPSGPDRLCARLELTRSGPELTSSGIDEAVSGIRGFRLLRLGGSAFFGFVRDQYTTLPDIHNRPLHMWLDLEWSYIEPSKAFSGGKIPRSVRSIVREVFESFESGSIQQIVYQIGQKILQEIADISEVHLEANNRTWDTVAECGEEAGVYTDARPPYGCLGLRLKRS